MHILREGKKTIKVLWSEYQFNSFPTAHGAYAFRGVLPGAQPLWDSRQTSPPKSEVLPRTRDSEPRPRDVGLRNLPK